MKQSFLFFLSLFVFFSLNRLAAQSAFINEVNYIASDPSTAGLEIAGEAGQDLQGWSVILYELDGTVTTVEELQYALIPSQQNGYGTIWYEMDQMSGGNGIALANPAGSVVQFIGIGAAAINGITAREGAAAGMTSDYAGTQLIPDQALQLTGTGIELLDFSWSVLAGTTPGAVNNNQFFGMPIMALRAARPEAQTSAHQSENQIHTRIFPNPATHFVRLERTASSPDTAEESPVYLFDSSGRLIRQLRLAADQQYLEVDVRDLPNGSYLLRLVQGDKNTVHRIVKQ